jgi:hypothetical protein
MAENPERHTPEYWRAKAQEARSVVNNLATETNRQWMLAAADNFERLAAEAGLEKGHAFTRCA